MNFYEMLGVDQDADRSEIRSAYRERARHYHPDVNEHPEAGDQFRVLTRARGVLTEPEERDAYDRLGHADYVDKRIDGDFPEPEMTPPPRGRSGGGERSSDVSSRDSDSEPTGGSESSSSSRSSSSRPRSEGPDDPARHPGETTGWPTDSETATGSASSGDAGPTATADAGSPSSSDSSRETRSVPPTPGASESTTPESSRSKPRGPQRLEREETADRARGHFTASLRWLGVLAATGTYAAGVAGYVGANVQGLRALADALTSSDPAAVAGALGGARYGVPDPLTYAWTTGLRSGLVPADGALVLAGAVLLPITLALAVSGLRSRTTWRPSWMHAVGALGPAAAVALAFAVRYYPGVVPLTVVPLLLDVVLMAGVPLAVVTSFLANRFLLVLPLRRREDVVS